MTEIADQFSKGLLWFATFEIILEFRNQTIKVSGIKIGPIISRQRNLKERNWNPIEGEKNNGLKDVLIMSLSPKSKAEMEDAAVCPVSSLYPLPPPLSSVPQNPGKLRSCCQFPRLADIRLDWMLWKKAKGGIYSISTLPRSPLELKAAPSSCQKACLHSSPHQSLSPVPFPRRLTCDLDHCLCSFRYR